MIQKNLDRLYYLCLLISVNTGYITVRLLTAFSFLFYKSHRKDVIIFPHEQKGSDGYNRRFEEFFPFLDKDKVDYFVCDITSDAFVRKSLNGSKFQQYYLYHLCLWTRIFQVLKAGKFKKAFVQRKIYPFYPDLNNALLEKLLRKLNDNIYFDFWDSVYVVNPDLVHKCIENSDHLTLVNQHLYDYFSFFKGNRHLWPIGINLSLYVTKNNYDINNTVKLFWTGQPGNLEYNLIPLVPILERLGKKFPVELVIVGHASIDTNPHFRVTHHQFNLNTFFTHIAESDICLYPMFEDIETAKGKMAMKVLDGFGSAVPVIGCPYGISPYVVEDKHMVFINNKEEWEPKLETLITNKELRTKIGENGQKLVEKYHSLEYSYQLFKAIISDHRN